MSAFEVFILMLVKAIEKYLDKLINLMS